MELGKQIKTFRQEAQLSQEELADRVYVSRQTISNWENDKSYPDVNSLVLLSEVFHISLDKLIKGDIEMMKNVINKDDVLRLNRYGNISGLLMIFCVISVAPMFIFIGKWSILPLGIIFATAIYYANKIERIKKDNDIQTYKEIVAFTEGKKLDEIQKQREIGKRPYQKFLIAAAGAVIAALVSFVIAYLIMAIRG